MNTETIFRGPNIKVTCDTREIIPQDPGAGTPVIVEWVNKETNQSGCGTWNAVISEHEDADGVSLTYEQENWLENINPKIEKWLQENNV